MELHEIKIVKQDERGIIYDCGASNFIVRKKGTISANHMHDDDETIYLVEWEIELTIDQDTQITKAPIMFTIKSNTYHKLVALTDIKLVIDRH